MGRSWLRIILTGLLLIGGIGLHGQTKELYEQVKLLTRMLKDRDSVLIVQEQRLLQADAKRLEQDGLIAALRKNLQASQAMADMYQRQSLARGDSIKHQKLVIREKEETILAWVNRFEELQQEKDALTAKSERQRDTIILYEALVDTFSNLVTSASCRIYGIYKPGWLNFKKKKHLKIDPVGDKYRERAGRIKELEFNVNIVRPQLSPDLDKNLHILFGPSDPKVGQIVELTEPQPLKRYRKKIQGDWVTFLYSPPPIKLTRGKRRRVKASAPNDDLLVAKGGERKTRKRKKNVHLISRRYSGTKLKRNTSYTFKIYLGDDPHDKENILASGRFKTR